MATNTNVPMARAHYRVISFIDTFQRHPQTRNLPLACYKLPRARRTPPVFPPVPLGYPLLLGQLLLVPYLLAPRVLFQNTRRWPIPSGGRRCSWGSSSVSSAISFRLIPNHISATSAKSGSPHIPCHPLANEPFVTSKTVLLFGG